MIENLGVFELVVIFISIVIGITLHEMMHAYAGLKLGDTTAHEMGRVSLNPLRHVDPLGTIVLPIITLVFFGAPFLAAKPVPFNPARVKWDEFGAALIALAGPLTNLALAALGALWVNFFVTSPEVFNVAYIFIAMNVGLFVFNMLPIPPLDGSRVLYAVAPEAIQDIMRRMEVIGFVIIMVLVFAVPGFVDLLVELNKTVLEFLI